MIADIDLRSRDARQRHLRTLAAGALLITGAALIGTAHAQLPASQTSQGIEYVTGGFGSDESDAFKQAESNYPLALTFAAADEGGGARPYVAEVHVVIKDKSGQAVMDVPSVGPYFLARLKPGSYQVEATYNGVTQTRDVAIRESGSAQEVFTWKRP